MKQRYYAVIRSLNQDPFEVFANNPLEAAYLFNKMYMDTDEDMLAMFERPCSIVIYQKDGHLETVKAEVFYK